MARPSILVGVAAVVVLAIAATAGLPRVVEAPRVQSLIASSAAQALARPVRFRSASVSVLPYPAVRLRGIEIAEDPAFGVGPFLRSDGADFRLKLWPLLRGRVEFATLVLEQPTITLVQRPGGRWNFASLAREGATAPRAPRTAGGAAPSGQVARVVIDRGRVVYERRVAGAVAARLRLEDVDGTLSSRSGALSFSGSARVMPGGLLVKIAEGTIALGGARALAEANLRARMEIDGEDVRALAAAAFGGEPAVGGSLTGRFDVSGTVDRPRATGEVEWRSPTVTRTTAACEAPRRRTLALATVKARVSWRDGRLVAEPLALERIPLERVLVDFLCQGYAVAGPLDLTGTLALSPDDPLVTLSGSGRIRVGAGKVVGARALALLGGLARVGGPVSSVAGPDLPATLAASPLEFDSIAASYEIANGVVTTRDWLYASRALTIRVRGEYAIASGRVNAEAVLERERGVFQARVTGTAESPTIRMTPSLARR